MPAIPEGKHTFDFPDADGWYAVKYDELDAKKSGFYRERVEVIKYKYHDARPADTHKGEGIKGVDIIAGKKPDFYDLTLLEIKDFRSNDKQLEKMVASGEIPGVIEQKVLHTWGALCLGARAGDALLPADLRAAILRPPQHLRVVFFLAQTPLHPAATRIEQSSRQNRWVGIRQKLNGKLKHLGFKTHLADSNNLPDRCGWTVTELP